MGRGWLQAAWLHIQKGPPFQSSKVMSDEARHQKSSSSLHTFVSAHTCTRRIAQSYTSTHTKPLHVDGFLGYSHTHINIWEALLPNATQEPLLAQTSHGKQNWETIGKSERNRTKNPGEQQVCPSQTCPSGVTLNSTHTNECQEQIRTLLDVFSPYLFFFISCIVCSTNFSMSY